MHKFIVPNLFMLIENLFNDKTDKISRLVRVIRRIKRINIKAVFVFLHLRYLYQRKDNFSIPPVRIDEQSLFALIIEFLLLLKYFFPRLSLDFKPHACFFFLFHYLNDKLLKFGIQQLVLAYLNPSFKKMK